MVTRRLLLNYEAEQPESLVVIDRVQAGLDPPLQLVCPPFWGAMLKHFHTGVWLYDTQDGSANSGTVARVAAGGGAIAEKPPFSP